MTLSKDPRFSEKLRFLTENNLLIIPPSLLDLLKNGDSDDTWYNFIQATRENGTFEINSVLFHSRRDPSREATRQVESTAGGGTAHLVAVGAGAGHIFTPFLQHPRLESVLVLECDLLSLIALIDNFPDKLWEQNPKPILVYFSEFPESDLLEDTLPFFRNKEVSRFSFYTHRPSFQAFPEKFSALNKQVKTLLHKRSVNQATIVKFQEIWNKNLILNTPEIVKGNKLDQLIEKAKGRYPNIVICGAGPSLQQSISGLKKFRKNYLLIAADTAFIPLTRQGITPDIVITADPQMINRFFAMTPRAPDSAWILDPVVTYHSARYLNQAGAKCFWWDNPFAIDQIIRQITGDRGQIAHGGSVSTNAFDLALQLDAEKIILAGQDLSFPEKQAHVKGAALEEQIYSSNNRLRTFENHNYRQMTALPPIEVKNSINGSKIFTNEKLRLFIEWFENQAAKLQTGNKKVSLFNITASGVSLHGFQNTTADRLFKTAGKTPDLADLPGYHNIQSPPDTFQNIKKEFAVIRDQTRQLSKLYKENMKLAGSGSNGPAQKSHIEKLQRNDKKILALPLANEIISLFAQATILGITEHNDRSEQSPVELYRALYLASRKADYLLSKTVDSLRH